jgi:glyoxylase-like metal-dependent hydrolase (beta-lactamase superfamily II)
MLQVHLVVSTFYQTNCWVIELPEEKLCAVVDPGFAPRKAWKTIKDLAAETRFILFTHGHIDHLYGARYLQQKTRASCLLHPLDDKFRWRWLAFSRAKFSPLADGQLLKLGSAQIKVIHTPGHSPGSVSYLVEDCLFSGDLLFADGVGRWDIPGGDFREIVRSLQDRLKELPDDIKVMPGHGPQTTLAIERSRNPIFWKKDQA